jgi:hypothetical protein
MLRAEVLLPKEQSFKLNDLLFLLSGWLHRGQKVNGISGIRVHRGLEYGYCQYHTQYPTVSKEL